MEKLKQKMRIIEIFAVIGLVSGLIIGIIVGFAEGDVFALSIAGLIIGLHFGLGITSLVTICKWAWSTAGVISNFLSAPTIVSFLIRFFCWYFLFAFPLAFAGSFVTIYRYLKIRKQLQDEKFDE